MLQTRTAQEGDPLIGDKTRHIGWKTGHNQRHLMTLANKQLIRRYEKHDLLHHRTNLIDGYKKPASLRFDLIEQRLNEHSARCSSSVSFASFDFFCIFRLSP